MHTRYPQFAHTERIYVHVTILHDISDAPFVIGYVARLPVDHHCAGHTGGDAAREDIEQARTKKPQ